jgi:hypothetical protein
MLFPDIAVVGVCAVDEIAVTQFIPEQGDDTVLSLAFGTVNGNGLSLLFIIAMRR